MARPREEYIIDESGKKKAVVMPFKKYQQLLEGIHDLAVVAERRNEGTVSLAELKRRLKADGLLRD
jgi:hypothetical protein